MSLLKCSLSGNVSRKKECWMCVQNGRFLSCKAVTAGRLGVCEEAPVAKGDSSAGRCQEGVVLPIRGEGRGRRVV